VLNVATVLAGSGVGVLLGDRLQQRVRDVITDGLALVVLLIAGLNAAAVRDHDFVSAVGKSATVLVVLGAVVLGGLVGSLLRLEARLESFGGWLQRRLSRGATSTSRARFIEGYVVASLVFCVGPVTVLGSIEDGLGRGVDQLALKSTLDGFAAVAFAATFGWGVAASAITVGVLQGALTVVGWLAGSFLGDAELAALTATGGLLLVGVAFRLLRLRPLPVVDLLPALILAPAITAVVAHVR
jgi:uncharacterized membrane protein YqgA involved in biofilm formation